MAGEGANKKARPDSGCAFLFVRGDDCGQASVYLQRTGETIVPSFLSWANTLSTIFLSSPVSSATLEALTGSPALRMASITVFFSSMTITNKLLTQILLLHFLEVDILHLVVGTGG